MESDVNDQEIASLATKICIQHFFPLGLHVSQAYIQNSSSFLANRWNTIPISDRPDAFLSIIGGTRNFIAEQMYLAEKQANGRNVHWPQAMACACAFDAFKIMIDKSSGKKSGHE